VDKRFEIQVVSEENKKKLEDVIFDRFRNLSKLYLRKIIKSEKCEVNGRFENRGYRLRPNDFIEIELDPDKQNSMVPEDLPLEVIVDDPEFVVVDKPIGMLVHPSNKDKSGTVLNALAYRLNRDNPSAHIRPGLIHRLDKETSGLLVVSKNTRAHGRIAIQFEKKRVEKKYLALVDGLVEEQEGSISAPIGRYGDEKRWAVKEDGKEALTKFRVLERLETATLLELEPVTGRTNQLRIHCAEIGHPIVGDTLRGGSNFRRLCLHAYRLAFRHPSRRETVSVEHPVDFGFEQN
jgi:23S rRNA pseudouridine1911/1915/1917 synthase